MTVTVPCSLSPSEGWTYNPDGSSTRALAGSEAMLRKAALYMDGHLDNVMWFALTTRLPNVAGLFFKAFIRLRLSAPLIAADIVPDPQDNGQECWSYTPLRDHHEALAWVKATLVVEHTDRSNEDIVTQLNQTRLPYVVPGGHKQYFKCHLLLRPDGVHSVVMHGTHVVLDGQTGLWLFRRLVESVKSISGASPRKTMRTLGDEVANLPAPLDSAVNEAPSEGTDDEAACAIPQIPNDDTGLLLLLPQRSTVTTPGRTAHVTRALTATAFTPILDALRTHSLTVTALLDASHALALAIMNTPLPLNAHVMLPFQPIALQRFLAPPHTPETYLTSCLSTTPLRLPLAALPHATPRARVLAAARVFKAQYAAALACPAALMRCAVSPTNADAPPGSLATSNLGVVERCVQRVWAGADGETCIEVVSCGIGARVTGDLGALMTHAWTLGGALYLRMQAPDTYDEEFLGVFLDHVVTNMQSISEDK